MVGDNISSGGPFGDLRHALGTYDRHRELTTYSGGFAARTRGRLAAPSGVRIGVQMCGPNGGAGEGSGEGSGEASGEASREASGEASGEVPARTEFKVSESGFSGFRGGVRGGVRGGPGWSPPAQNVSPLS